MSETTETTEENPEVKFKRPHYDEAYATIEKVQLARLENAWRALEALIPVLTGFGGNYERVGCFIAPIVEKMSDVFYHCDIPC